MYIQKFKEMKQEHGNKMTALVVGGAGGHLCDRLIMEGYNVVCVDNLSYRQYGKYKASAI